MKRKALVPISYLQDIDSAIASFKSRTITEIWKRAEENTDAKLLEANYRASVACINSMYREIVALATCRVKAGPEDSAFTPGDYSKCIQEAESQSQQVKESLGQIKQIQDSIEASQKLQQVAKSELQGLTEQLALSSAQQSDCSNSLKQLSLERMQFLKHSQELTKRTQELSELPVTSLSPHSLQPIPSSLQRLNRVAMELEDTLCSLFNLQSLVLATEQHRRHELSARDKAQTECNEANHCTAAARAAREDVESAISSIQQQSNSLSTSLPAKERKSEQIKEKFEISRMHIEDAVSGYLKQEDKRKSLRLVLSAKRNQNSQLQSAFQSRTNSLELAILNANYTRNSSFQKTLETRRVSEESRLLAKHEQAKQQLKQENAVIKSSKILELHNSLCN